MQSEHKGGERNKSVEHIVLAAEENRGQIQECQLLGKPSLDYSSVQGAAALTLFKMLSAKSCFHSDLLYSHRDTAAALTHAPLEPHSPVPHTRARGSQWTLTAAEETSTIYFHPLSPCSHVLSRATSQGLSVPHGIPSLLEEVGFPGKDGRRHRVILRQKEKLPRKRARDSGG